MSKCKQCGYAGHPETFDVCFLVFHDLRCPKCGTTNVDTSDLAADPEYGYGKNNTLDLSNVQGDE